MGYLKVVSRIVAQLESLFKISIPACFRFAIRPKAAPAAWSNLPVFNLARISIR
ncbi:hypothetical protein HMPREF9371_0973 [Neisseria shayeganii 871]|uniref:Uncharacterized protein n=1 Tax=Neisseria shayeganii 871 TaxID=1032488 RepID=G4CH84_9NEIS|nr:hypothetical protein HMPREF9371_0973 [Neisseria shayeganii 871]